MEGRMQTADGSNDNGGNGTAYFPSQPDGRKQYSPVLFAPDTGAGSGAGASAAPSGGGAAVAEAPAGNDGGGQQVDAGQGGGQQQAAGGGWETQPLPEGHWGYARGAKTHGEVERIHQENQQQAARQAEDRIRDHYAEVLLEQARAVSGAQQQQAQPQQQAAPKNQWFGFGSREAYQAAMQSNPESAVQQAMLHSLKSNPDVLRELMQGQVQQTIAPIQQQMWQQQRAAEHDQFVTQNPAFAPDKPLYQAAVKNLERMGIPHEIGSKLPVGFLMKAAAFDILQQQNKASDARLTQQRTTAASARAGAAGNSAPKNGSFEDNIRAKAAEQAAAGNPISEQQIQDAIQRGKRMGFVK